MRRALSCRTDEPSRVAAFDDHSLSTQPAIFVKDGRFTPRDEMVNYSYVVFYRTRQVGFVSEMACHCLECGITNNGFLNRISVLFFGFPNRATLCLRRERPEGDCQRRNSYVFGSFHLRQANDYFVARKRGRFFGGLFFRARKREKKFGVFLVFFWYFFLFLCFWVFRFFVFRTLARFFFWFVFSLYAKQNREFLLWGLRDTTVQPR